MIVTKEIKLTKIENLTSMYIESSLKDMGFNVLKWSIVNVTDEDYIVNIAVIE